MTEPRRSGRVTIDDQLRESLKSTYDGVGMLLIGLGMPRSDVGLVGTGTMMVERSEAAAAAWMDLADKNAKVKAALRRFTEGSSAATLIAIHVSMAAPILASRGIVPEAVANAMAVQPIDPDPRAAAEGNGEADTATSST